MLWELSIEPKVFSEVASGPLGSVIQQIHRMGSSKGFFKEFKDQKLVKELA